MKDCRRKQLQQQRGDLPGGGGGLVPKGKPYAGGGEDKGRASSWCTLTVVLCCAILSALTFSAFRLFGGILPLFFLLDSAQMPQ